MILRRTRESIEELSLRELDSVNFFCRIKVLLTQNRPELQIQNSLRIWIKVNTYAIT